MNLKIFERTIREQLQKRLPGEAAWAKMAPEGRQLNFKGNGNIRAKKSAVLLLFFPESENLNLVLIKRAITNGKHSGQISFPGGAMDEIDGSAQDTALRETFEEVGVKKEDVSILGLLSTLHIYVSGYTVSPVVGVTKERPKFKKNQREVDAILTVPFGDFLKPDNNKIKKMQINGKKIKIPYYDINNVHVWGATAMILSEFIDLIHQGEINNKIWFFKT